MKSIPLKDLDWFSFTSNLNKLKYLSKFQAIAYIMRNEDNLIPIGKDYERSIHIREVLAIQEIYNPNLVRGFLPTMNQIENFNDTGLFIPDDAEPVPVLITTLRNNRNHITENFGVATSILHSLLQSEIEKYQSNESVNLQIKTKTIGGYTEFYFKRIDLKKWKSLSVIKDLGLLNENVISTDKQRNIKEINQQKITGMLIHLLANQALNAKGKGKEAKFTHGSDVTNINSSGIYNYFKDGFLDKETESVKELRTFPRQRTVTDYLEDSFKTFKNYVDLK